MTDADLTPRGFITAFLLQQIASQPSSHRIMLYRALAHETHDKKLAAECVELARELEATLRRERQLLFDFRRRAGGQA